MRYFSTRNLNNRVTGAQAILQGLASDGGLYVPETIPRVDFSTWKTFSYTEIASRILSLYFTDFTDETIRNLVFRAYDARFSVDSKVRVRRISPKRGYLELWHGPTAAFKDMALSILPYLMQAAQEIEKKRQKVLILTATSGDTGKASMIGFSKNQDMGVLVFYPRAGVSAMQRRQMRSPESPNALAVAVEGNFDDCQKAVKRIFADPMTKKRLFEQGIVLSSANSINIGRLVPQIVYYVYAYLEAVRNGVLSYGEKLSCSVPTGNFGDVLAGFYAREMGLPLGKLLVASNSNHVLTDFAREGIYDKRRKLRLTASPSMDILVSGNLERFLYLKLHDTEKVKQLMGNLDTKGYFELPNPEAKYEAEWIDEEKTGEEIHRIWEESRYLIDPHTAVASASVPANSDFPWLILSTASPYKFSEKVLEALGADADDDLQTRIDTLYRLTGTPVPEGLLRMFSQQSRQEITLSEDKLAHFVSKAAQPVVDGQVEALIESLSKGGAAWNKS